VCEDAECGSSLRPAPVPHCSSLGCCVWLQWGLQRMKTAAGMYTLLCNGTAGTAPPWHPQAGREYTLGDAAMAVGVVPTNPVAEVNSACWIHVQQENLWWG